jgi:hypothetical protein
MKLESEKATLLLRGAVIVSLIVLSAMLRILPHPWNFTPVGAIALFSGAMFRNRCIAFLLPLVSLFAGDVFVGFHKLMLVVYTGFAVSVAIGRGLAENRSVTRIGGAVLLGALQFFVVTNFAMWAVGGFYPKTTAGLASCMVAGIPYFWNTLAGDVLYACVSFGGFALAEKMVPAIRPRSA